MNSRPTRLGNRLNQLAILTQHERASQLIVEHKFHREWQRKAAKLLLSMPAMADKLYDSRFVRPYKRAGYDVIGVGYNAIALDDGVNTVRKVYPSSRLMDAVQLDSYIIELTTNQSATLNYLSDVAIEQAFSVDEDPLNPTLPILTAKQQRIYGESATPLLRAHHPSMKKFIYDSRRMHSDIHAVPDIIGNSNIISTEMGNLALIDTINLDSIKSPATFNEAYEILFASN